MKRLLLSMTILLAGISSSFAQLGGGGLDSSLPLPNLVTANREVVTVVPGSGSTPTLISYEFDVKNIGTWASQASQAGILVSAVDYDANATTFYNQFYFPCPALAVGQTHHVTLTFAVPNTTDDVAAVAQADAGHFGGFWGQVYESNEDNNRLFHGIEL